MTEIILYGGIVIAAILAFSVGKTLDRQQSSDGVAWEAGCINRSTVMQSFALGILLGPIVYLIKSDGSLLYCVLCMMVASFLVDLLRPPTVTYDHSVKPVQLNRPGLSIAPIATIVICISLIGLFIFFNLKLYQE